MKTILITAFALTAFAGNSILCRLALGDATIDAASFTSIRLLSGIIVLFIILQLTQGKKENLERTKGSWKAGLMLFIYAIGFSYAYISLETGTGALILFASVQITMIGLSIIKGNKLFLIEWVGIAIAFAGFTYLMLPGVAAPSFYGFVFMTAAGMAWGVYTLAGKGSKNPLADTAHNFFKTLPLVVVLVLATFLKSHLSSEGIILAILSGGLTSGIGYTIWYMALGGLSPIQAAILQLLVPVIAAAGGILFSAEVLSLRLVMSAMLILGGILIVILGKHYFEKGLKT